MNDEEEKDAWVYIILFMFYSLCGAILEHLLYFFSSKRKILNNPILTGFPLYGIGAYLVIIIHRWIGHKLDIIVQFVLYAAILTYLEYTIGRMVGAGHERGMYIKSWDYSNSKYNYKGIIDVNHFLLFGIAALIVVRVHPFLVKKANLMF